MAISNYQHGFKAGVTIRGVPVEITHPGRVFWVGNNATRLDNEKTAADGNDGSFLAPWSTVMGGHDNAAVKAARGDIIFVRPGYTETLSSATDWTISKSGVAIIGLGSGTARPTITFDTATDTINVTAANVAIRNLICSASGVSVTAAITTSLAASLSVEDCFFKDASATVVFENLVDTNAVANSADDLYFARNVQSGGSSAGVNSPFNVDAAQAGWTIKDNYITTKFVPTLGVFDVAGSAAVTFMNVTGNYFKNATVTVTGLVVPAAAASSRASGLIMNNVFSYGVAGTSAAVTVGTAASGVVRLANVVQALHNGAALGASAACEIEIIRQKWA